MSHTGKKVCLIVTIVFTLAFFAISIYFTVQAATLNSKINDGIADNWGTEGVSITPPGGANSSLVEKGTVKPGDLILYRWDHQKGDNTLTHITAVLQNMHLEANNNTNTTTNIVGLCVANYYSPTLSGCKVGFRSNDSVGMCNTFKGSAYIGIYTNSSVPQSFAVTITWGSESSDSAVCDGLGIVTGALTALGLLGIGIVLAITGCYFLICCISSIYLAVDVRKHHGYQEVGHI